MSRASVPPPGPPSTFTHCSPRVTPGRAPVRATLWPVSRLRSEDLPTLDTPTTTRRSGLRQERPASAERRLPSQARTSSSPAPVRASTATASSPRAARYASHSDVAPGSARSARERISSLGLPSRSPARCGLRDAAGARASATSSTTSTSRSLSLSSRTAFAMWPGYQLTPTTRGAGPPPSYARPPVRRRPLR